jgi:hypothetical protein
LTSTAGILLGLGLSALSVPASAVELDSDGYAKVLIKGVQGAEQLWIEVEDPGLSAVNTAITVDGQPVPAIDTALGAAAIVRPGTEDVEVTIGVSVAADPDIAFTTLGAAGAVLYTEHYRASMSVARPRSTETTSPTPVVTATVAPASSAVVPIAASEPAAGEVKTQGILADTGAILGVLVPVGVAIVLLGLVIVAAIRKKVQA